MKKRKPLDFTADYTVEILQSKANGGRFWSQIVYGEARVSQIVWEQADLSETRTEALDRAENMLETMLREWLNEVSDD